MNGDQPIALATLRPPPTFDGMSFERWVETGKRLCRVGARVNWWIGDWWIAGHRYGERARVVAEGLVFELALQTLMNLGTVARAFETSRRREVLSWKHHAEVAVLPRALADAALARAEREKLSTRDMRLIANEYRRERQTAQLLDLNARSTPLVAARRYALLYADPPWRYDHSVSMRRDIENQYPTMELEEICALPIADLAGEHSILFLWATSPKLAESMEVIERWGFVYRTSAVWVKTQLGMGYHFRSKHEFLLVAKRGDMPPPPPNARPLSVFEAPRGRHSEKPDVVYDMLERMYPHLPRVELFQRAPREGWDGWGNEAGGGSGA